MIHRVGESDLNHRVVTGIMDRQATKIHRLKLQLTVKNYEIKKPNVRCNEITKKDSTRNEMKADCEERTCLCSVGALNVRNHQKNEKEKEKRDKEEERTIYPGNPGKNKRQRCTFHPNEGCICQPVALMTTAAEQMQ